MSEDSKNMKVVPTDTSENIKDKAPTIWDNVVEYFIKIIRYLGPKYAVVFIMSSIALYQTCNFQLKIEEMEKDIQNTVKEVKKDLENTNLNVTRNTGEIHSVNEKMFIIDENRKRELNSLRDNDKEIKTEGNDRDKEVKRVSRSLNSLQSDVANIKSFHNASFISGKGMTNFIPKKEENP